MIQYVKVMFENKEANYEYQIDKVNIANNWNPSAKNGREFGGFNFSTEDKIIRWLHRGDTIYDVIIPKDTEIIDCIDSATPHGVFRSNKIIITNPRKVTDEMALEFYKKSTIPKEAYYKALGVVSIMGYRNTALQILRDKVNSGNIDLVLSEWNDFISRDSRRLLNKTVKLIDEYLKEIKSDILISLSVAKNPYEKKLSDDAIINLTGQSGSGKSYYAQKFFSSNKYAIIDTDEIFTNDRFVNANGLNYKLGIMFREKYKVLPSLIADFDLIYSEILNYCKNYNKIIVIDCAQFHCIKNINLLKGKIIVIRTDIDTCYQRTIDRWLKKHSHIGYSEEELRKYQERKKAIYAWYKETNKFIDKIDKL